MCLTEDCVRAAATILSSVDRSADPCQDFYQVPKLKKNKKKPYTQLGFFFQFACGGFMAASPPGVDSDRFSAIDRLNQNIVAR